MPKLHLLIALHFPGLDDAETALRKSYEVTIDWVHNSKAEDVTAADCDEMLGKWERAVLDFRKALKAIAREETPNRATRSLDTRANAKAQGQGTHGSSKGKRGSEIRMADHLPS